jgi:hypothetical protein
LHILRSGLDLNISGSFGANTSAAVSSVPDPRTAESKAVLFWRSGTAPNYDQQMDDPKIGIKEAASEPTWLS